MPSAARSNSSIGRKIVEKTTVQRQRTNATEKDSPKQSSHPQSTASPSPYSNIRSPEHWLPYSIVIQGVITAVTEKMNNLELRRKVASCLSDVINNQKSLLSAYQTHFQKKDKNTTTTRNYHKIARQILVEHLGEENLDQRLLPYLSQSTTFDQLKIIVESLKNTKGTPAKSKHPHPIPANTTETPPKATRRTTTAFRTTSTIPAPKRRFGLEESDDEDAYQPATKKPELQTKRSYSRASFQKSTPVSRKKEKEKDLSQEEEEIPPRGQSLLSSNENANQGVLVPFLNGNTRNRGNDMELSTFGHYEQHQNGLLRDRQNRLSIQRRQVLFTARNRKPTKFRGTAEELRVELRKVLDGHYHGDIDDMVEVVLKYVLMAHQMASALHRSKIPLDLLVSSMGYISRFIQLDDLELDDE